MSTDILELPAPPASYEVAYGEHPLQVGDLRLPRGMGPHPLVLVVHGGFWRARRDRHYAGHLSAALLAAGYASWNIEYRRIGDEGGGWPGTLLDVARAADYLPTLAREYGLDTGRVVTLGHSAGGQLALWLAARHRIPVSDRLYGPPAVALRGAIALGGVVDLRMAYQLALGDGVVEQFLGGSPEQVPDRYATASPLELLPLGIAQTLIHGTLDEDVPVALAEHYAAVAAERGETVRLLTLQGVGHFEPVDPRSAAWSRVLEEVRELLPSTGS